jgi:hypothetical protein
VLVTVRVERMIWDSVAAILEQQAKKGMTPDLGSHKSHLLAVALAEVVRHLLQVTARANEVTGK